MTLAVNIGTSSGAINPALFNASLGAAAIQNPVQGVLSQSSIESVRSVRLPHARAAAGLGAAMRPNLFKAGAYDPVFDTAERYATEVERWVYEYAPLREELHGRIVDQLLLSGQVSDSPVAIFTAGPPGVGKSVVVSALERAGILDPKTFLWIDPDVIKEQIPEYEDFKKIDPFEAASMVHAESGHIQEKLLESALGKNKMIVVDGTLAGKEWWRSEFTRIQEMYPDFSISIVYVNADMETILLRVQARGEKTGRFVPQEVIKQRYEAVMDSVDELKTIADATIGISNDDQPRIVSFHKDGQDYDVQIDLSLKDGLSSVLDIEGRDVQKVSEFHAGSFENQLLQKNITQVDYQGLKEEAEGRQVVILGGYSGLGFDNPALVKEYIRQMMIARGDHALYVVGATEAGIGMAYQWIPEIAGELGFEDVHTAGIISERDKDKALARQDILMVVPENEQKGSGVRPSVALRLKLALETGGEMIFVKGARTTLHEARAAIEAGVDVTLLRDPAVRPSPERVAAKLIAAPGYNFDPLRELEVLAQEHDHVKLDTEIKARDNWDIEQTHRVRQGIMGFEKMTTDEMVTWLVQSYPEILGLATDSINATPEKIKDVGSVGAGGGEVQEFDIDRDVLAQRLKFILKDGVPENMNVPTEGLKSSFSQQIFNKFYMEFDRTVMAVACLKWILAGDYEQFTACQNDDGSRLSKEQFDRMRNMVRATINTPEDRDAMITLLVLNQLGKSDVVMNYIRESAGESGKNHQEVLDVILAKYPFIVPSFYRLDSRRQNLIRESLETSFNMAQVIQGEAAAINYLELAKKSREGAEFYLVSSLLKVAAAAGHGVRNGSVVMHGGTYGGLELGLESVGQFYEALSRRVDAKNAANSAYESFLENKSGLLGINFKASDRSSKNLTKKAATRVALFMRAGSEQEGRVALQAIEMLPAGDRELLVNELDYDGMNNGSSVLLYFMPAVASNLKLEFGDTQDFQEYVDLLCRVLVKTFKAVRDSVVFTEGSVQIRMDDVADEINAVLAGGRAQNIEIYRHPMRGLSARWKV